MNSRTSTAIALATLLGAACSTKAHEPGDADAEEKLDILEKRARDEGHGSVVAPLPSNTVRRHHELEPC